MVIIVTLAVAGGAAYLAHRSAATYKAKAFVLVAQIFPPNTPNYSITPFVDDFQTVLTTTKILDQTSKLSGEPVKKITTGLTSSQVGTTLDVEVDYSSTNPAAAVSVVKNSSRLALELLARDRLTADQRALTQANRDYSAAVAALGTYTSVHGSDGSVQFNALNADVDRTRTRVADVANQVSDDQVQIVAAGSNQSLTLEGPTKQSKLTNEIRSAASAGILAGAATTLLLLAIGWRRRPAIRWRADAGVRARLD